MKDNYLCHKKGVYRDFLYIDDLVYLIDQILKKKEIDHISGKIFNVGYGKPIELIRAARKIEKLCKGGVQLSKRAILRKDEPKIIFPDISAVKKTFKWKPKINFENGLKKTIHYYESISKN